MKRRLLPFVVLAACWILIASAMGGCGVVPLTDGGASSTTTTLSTGGSATVALPSTSTEVPTSSTVGVGALTLRTPSLAEIAYIELTHPTLRVVSAEGRRILSPAIDAATIEEILGAFSEITVGAGAEPPYEDMDVQLAIHLRDGSALVLLGNLDQKQPGAVRTYEGRPDKVPQGEELHFPSLSANLQAPSLFALVDRILAADVAAANSVDPSEGALPADMPADFGFVAAFGTYGKMVLDTFAGAFYKDMILPQYTTSTADLGLAEAELREAYARLVALDLLSYPADFAPKTNTRVTPNQAYYLRIRAGGMEKEIRWDDSTLSSESKANALRDWFKWLQDLVYQKAEYEALPDFRGGYA